MLELNSNCARRLTTMCMNCRSLLNCITSIFISLKISQEIDLGFIAGVPGLLPEECLQREMPSFGIEFCCQFR